MRWVVTEGDPRSESVERVGRKGAALFRAAREGLPVPPFFALDATLLAVVREAGGALPVELRAELETAIGALATARPEAHGLVSVRSSPDASDPGALGTVLDVGATRALADDASQPLGSRKLALDLRLRHLSSIARLMPGHAAPATRVAATRVSREAPGEDELARRIAALEASLGPDIAALGAIEQLELAIARVLAGAGARASLALVIQAMVLGNGGAESGVGVAMTADPFSGERVLTGEFLPDAQGDELMGGRASPTALTASAAGRRAHESLERHAPAAFAELASVVRAIDRWSPMPHEIELTVERGRLFVLQVRPATITPRARVRLVVDAHVRGLMSARDAACAVAPSELASLVERHVSPGDAPVLLSGLGASPGACSGPVVIREDDPELARGVLLRNDASPEDAPAIRKAMATLTASGGLTSHAAVIARSVSRPCIVAASALRVDLGRGTAEVRGGGQVRALPRGEIITIDGRTGRVWLGALPIEARLAMGEAAQLLELAESLAGRSEGDPVQRLEVAQRILRSTGTEG